METRPFSPPRLGPGNEARKGSKKIGIIEALEDERTLRSGSISEDDPMLYEIQRGIQLYPVVISSLV